MPPRNHSCTAERPAADRAAADRAAADRAASHGHAERLARGSAPIAVILLVGLCVVLAAGAGAALTNPALQAEPRFVTIDGSANADGTITLDHTGGAALDVRRLAVVVTVEGTPLTHQPPVPFFSTTGFHGGPHGPFNSAADPAWTTGEIAGFRIAGTNDPPLLPGNEVVVRLSIGEQPVALVTMKVKI